jgi:hypothetical protein
LLSRMLHLRQPRADPCQFAKKKTYACNVKLMAKGHNLSLVALRSYGQGALQLAFGYYVHITFRPYK